MTEQEEHRHLLTVLHAAERTGPPVFALRFLRWLREVRPGWRTDTLFLDAGGELVDDFAALGRVIVRDPATSPAHPWLGGRINDRRLRAELRGLGPLDLVHVHCAGSMWVLPLLPDAPVICHLHELSVGLDYHLSPGARRHLVRADRYVAVADAVRTEFLSRFDVPAERVDRQWGFVDSDALRVEPDRAAARAEGDDFLVIASGVRHWRKAPELFLRVAHRARTRFPDRHWRFVWIGGGSAGTPDTYASLTDDGPNGPPVVFIDHVDEPLPVLAAADVFVLTAREDAFPLVCVEAASLGRPIITFDNGGTSELLRAGGCGKVIPYPDVDAMVDALEYLAGDADERKRLSDAAVTFAYEHLLLDARGPELLSTLETTMAHGRRG